MKLYLLIYSFSGTCQEKIQKKHKQEKDRNKLKFRQSAPSVIPQMKQIQKTQEEQIIEQGI